MSSSLGHVITHIHGWGCFQLLQLGKKKDLILKDGAFFPLKSPCSFLLWLIWIYSFLNRFPQRKPWLHLFSASLYGGSSKLKLSTQSPRLLLLRHDLIFHFLTPVILLTLNTNIIITWLHLCALSLIPHVNICFQEANKRNNNWLPPPWAILAIVILGFNEFMTLLR